MSDEKPEWLLRLEAQQCTCLSCGECHGSGSVWHDFRGNYLGNSPNDDLDQLENCTNCRGSGTTETCSRCLELEEYYEAKEEVL